MPFSDRPPLNGKPESGSGQEIKTNTEEAGDYGDQLSIGELRDFYISMRGELIRFLTRRTGNVELAADLTHDIFEKLPGIRAYIPSRQKARAYLYRMAANLAFDHMRIEKRRSELLYLDDSVSPEGVSSAEEVALLQEKFGAVQKALNELPGVVREVFMLIRLEGLKHKEIALQLGISVSAVEKYQARALEHCRKRLAE